MAEIINRLRSSAVALALGGLLFVVVGCGGVTEGAAAREQIISILEHSGEVVEFQFVPSGERGVVAFEAIIEGHGRFRGTYDGDWVRHYSADD